MDYKEKYNKLVDAIKVLQEANPSDEGIQNWVNDNVPELRESKDERIRKELIENFKWFCGDYPETSKWGKDDNLLVKDIIAWLEKQGEQKETNFVKILKHYPRETELYSPLYGKLWLAEVDEEHEIITCYKHPLEESCTRAVLEQEDTVSFYSNGTTGLPDCSVSKDCMLFLYDIEKQDGNSIRKRYDRIYVWDAENKELKLLITNGGDFESENCGQKPAWSEEDRTMAFTLMRDVDQMFYVSKEGKNERIGWLNSLDEKFASVESTWSEEDEAKLKSACALIRNTSLNENEGVVDSTIDWLKSLKQRIGG